MKKPQVPTPVEVARLIAQGKAPTSRLPDGSIDWILQGDAIRGAIEAGLVREDYGCNPNWGSYTVTTAGKKALET